MTTRNVGSEGENYFDGLCSNAGITANPSTKDKYGWDYIVEFPIEISPSETMDQKSAPIECKVQVKSTEKRDKKLQVKASVLYRLVKSQLPTFFCFFEFEHGHIPKNAYLLHVGFDLIDKVLGRVRNLEARGRANNLHNHTITIEYNDSHKFDHDSGHGLRELIQSHIPNGLDSYSQSKLAYLEKSGYTKESHRMNVTFSSRDVVEKLLDLEMGLIDSVSIEKIDAVSIRYDVELPDNQLSTFHGGRLSLPEKKSREGMLFFKETELSAPVEFIADIFLPHLTLTPSLNFRAKTKFFDLIVKHGNPEFSYILKDDDELKICELRNYAWVLDKIFSGKPLSVGLEINSQPFKFGQISPSVPECQSSPYKDLFELMEKALFICREFDINTDKVLVDTNALYAQQKSIDDFYALLHGSANLIKLSFKVEPNAPDISEFPLVASILRLSTKIGTKCFAMIGAVLADSKNGVLNEGECSVSAEKIVVHNKYVGTLEEINSINLDNDMKKLTLSLQEQGYEILTLNPN